MMTTLSLSKHWISDSAWQYYAEKYNYLKEKDREWVPIQPSVHEKSDGASRRSRLTKRHYTKSWGHTGLPIQDFPNRTEELKLL
jgi:hypothetical protein